MPISNGAGGHAWGLPPFSMGFWTTQDTATTGTPIPIVAADTYYYLTNDGLGPASGGAFGLAGHADPWNTSTNAFDFSAMDVGYAFTLSIDLNFITTGANTAVTLALELASGSAIEFDLIPLSAVNYKTAGTYQETILSHFWTGRQDIVDSPTKLKVKADGTGTTVVVNAWVLQVVSQ